MSEKPPDRRPAIDRGLITREHRAELIALGCVEPGTEEPIDDAKIDAEAREWELSQKRDAIPVKKRK